MQRWIVIIIIIIIIIIELIHWPFVWPADQKGPVKIWFGHGAFIQEYNVYTVFPLLNSEAFI